MTSEAALNGTLPKLSRGIAKRADQGLAEAQTVLGWWYETGRGVEQDAAQAVAWYRKAADQGHANAQLNLAEMYNFGRGVEQDVAQAAAWYRKAADQGWTLAKERLARLEQAM